MEIRTIKTNRAEMEYFSFGEGKEIFVILPGMSLISVMQSAEAVKAQYSVFKEKYTVYLFDRKKNITKGYSITDMADDTAEAMELLGLSDITLYGVSQGGMIAQRLTQRYPELVKKLVLASTLARNNDTSRETLSEWMCLAENGDPVLLNRAVFEKLYSPELIAANKDAFDMLEKMGTKEELERFAILAKACLDFDGYGDLDGITCKCAVMGGKKDRVTSGEALYELAEKLGCEPYVYNEYGHAVYDEASDFVTRLFETVTGL